jgi:mRNA interferase MazF
VLAIGTYFTINEENSGTVVAMALTSQPQRAGFPLTRELLKAKLKRESWVKISEVRTLSVEGIGEKLGQIDPTEMDQVIEGLNEIIG